VAPQLARTGDYVNGLLVNNTLDAGPTLDALSALAKLGASALPTALAQLHPEAYASSVDLAVEQQVAITGVVTDRVDRLAHDTATKRWSTWTSALARTTDLDGSLSAGTADVATDLHGLLFGVDARVATRTVVGALLGTSRGEQRLSGLDTDATFDYPLVAGLYAAYHGERLRLAALWSYSGGEVEMERRIHTAGVNGTARADYDLTHWAAHGEVGYAIWRSSHAVVEPRAGVDFISIERDGATERGATGLNLAVARETVDELSSEIGLRWSGRFAEASGTVWTPEMGVGWHERFTDADRWAVARFAGSGAPPFAVQSAEPDSGHARVNAGVTVALANDVRLFLHYDGAFGNDYRSSAGSVGAQWQF